MESWPRKYLISELLEDALSSFGTTQPTRLAFIAQPLLLFLNYSLREPCFPVNIAECLRRCLPLIQPVLIAIPKNINA